MTVKKALAAIVLGIALPLMADASADPYSDRGPVRSWLHGALPVAGMLTVAWAYEELAPLRAGEQITS